MTPFVADTGPLIALARAEQLDLLRRLYRRVVIPPAVRDELAIGTDRPGARHLENALSANWLAVESVASHRAIAELRRILDPGEAEAIALAEQLDARFLLIDDAAGRRAARRRGVLVTGVAGVLLAAKSRGAVAAVGTDPHRDGERRISPVSTPRRRCARESRGVAGGCHTRPVRKFNTEGPVVARDHYCVPPLERVNLRQILEFVGDRRYFVLHAPRQTGKTSALLALRDLLNSGAEGDYRCVYVNVEAAQAMREDVERATRVILGELASRARSQGDGFLYDAWPDILATFGEGAFAEALTRWCEESAPTPSCC